MRQQLQAYARADTRRGLHPLQGRLAFTDSHNGDQEWSLETLGSDEPAAYLLPGQPQDSITRQAVKPGSWVALVSWRKSGSLTGEQSDTCK